MPRFDPRRIAPSAAAFAAVLFSLGLLGGCATDELGPGGGKALWIGQSVSGGARQSVTMKGMEGVAITFLAGLDAEALVPLGTAVTDANGNYSILRANQTGTPGDFWWFSASGDEPITVYLALRATKTGFVPAEARQEILRTPSSTAPTRALDGYQLMLGAVLRPVSQE